MSRQVKRRAIARLTIAGAVALASIAGGGCSPDPGGSVTPPTLAPNCHALYRAGLKEATAVAPWTFEEKVDGAYPEIISQNSTDAARESGTKGTVTVPGKVGSAVRIPGRSSVLTMDDSPVVKPHPSPDGPITVAALTFWIYVDELEVAGTELRSLVGGTRPDGSLDWTVDQTTDGTGLHPTQGGVRPKAPHMLQTQSWNLVAVQTSTGGLAVSVNGEGPVWSTPNKAGRWADPANQLVNFIGPLAGADVAMTIDDVVLWDGTLSAGDVARLSNCAQPPVGDTDSPCEAEARGLGAMALWTLDDQSEGYYPDRITGTSGWNATPQNAAGAVPAPGAFRNAVRFAATTSATAVNGGRLTILNGPTPPSTGYTWSFWVNLPEADATQEQAFFDGSNFSIGQMPGSTGLSPMFVPAEFTKGSMIVAPFQSYPANVWWHVVMTFDPTAGSELWIDGDPAPPLTYQNVAPLFWTSTPPGTLPTFVSPTRIHGIGSRYNTEELLLDELALFDHPLNAIEVKNLSGCYENALEGAPTTSIPDVDQDTGQVDIDTGRALSLAPRPEPVDLVGSAIDIADVLWMVEPLPGEMTLVTCIEARLAGEGTQTGPEHRLPISRSDSGYAPHVLVRIHESAVGCQDPPSSESSRPPDSPSPTPVPPTTMTTVARSPECDAIDLPQAGELVVANIERDDPDGGLNIRSEPGPGADRLATAPNGSRLQSDGRCETSADGGVWWHITWPDQDVEGWARSTRADGTPLLSPRE